MKKVLTLVALGLTLSFGAAHAADASADCTAKAAEKKLAGAAKNSFMKKCVADAGGAAPAGAAPASAAAASSPNCEKAAADKKLAGAAKNSFMKKCMSEEKPAAKPEVAAKPASAAAPAASAEKKVSQQDKMKMCNAEAKGLKGEEFKKKRDECLKK